MRFNGAVQFIAQSGSTDSLRRPQATETAGSIVPCIIDAIGITENYAAMAAGFRPDVRIKVRAVEYNRQPHFVYASERYKVIRIQRAEKGFITIIGEAVNRG